ncbi:hypothetical protein HK096_009890, partial [Nowakowskiella sp. JEL0078]
MSFPNLEDDVDMSLYVNAFSPNMQADSHFDNPLDKPVQLQSDNALQDFDSMLNFNLPSSVLNHSYSNVSIDQSNDSPLDLATSNRVLFSPEMVLTQSEQHTLNNLNNYLTHPSQIDVFQVQNYLNQFQQHRESIDSELISPTILEPRTPMFNDFTPLLHPEFDPNVFSPFLLASSSGTPLMQPPENGYGEDDMQFPPLISPAMTPSGVFSKMTLSQNETFTPLSSPAILPGYGMDYNQPQSQTVGPHRRGSANAYDRKRTPHNSPYPRKQRPISTLTNATLVPLTSPMINPTSQPSSTSSSATLSYSQPQLIASPESLARIPSPVILRNLLTTATMTPQYETEKKQFSDLISPNLEPLSPAQIMRLNNSEKPVVSMKVKDQKQIMLSKPKSPNPAASPALKPILPGGVAKRNIQAVVQLTQKSNYDILMDGAS